MVFTAQRMKFSAKDFFGKREQIHEKTAGFLHFPLFKSNPERKTSFFWKYF